VNVSAAVRQLRLDRDEPAGNVAAIEHPIDRIAAEDGRNLLFGWKHDEGGLQ